MQRMIDCLFLECFQEVAKEYPELKADDVIVDICHEAGGTSQNLMW